MHLPADINLHIQLQLQNINFFFKAGGSSHYGNQILQLYTCSRTRAVSASNAETRGRSHGVESRWRRHSLSPAYKRRIVVQNASKSPDMTDILLEGTQS